MCRGEGVRDARQQQRQHHNNDNRHSAPITHTTTQAHNKQAAAARQAKDTAAAADDAEQAGGGRDTEDTHTVRQERGCVLLLLAGVCDMHNLFAHTCLALCILQQTTIGAAAGGPQTVPGHSRAEVSKQTNVCCR